MMFTCKILVCVPPADIDMQSEQGVSSKSYRIRANLVQTENRKVQNKVQYVVHDGGHVQVVVYFIETVLKQRSLDKFPAYN